MHVYTSEAKNTLNTLTLQRLSKMIRGEHPLKAICYRIDTYRLMS